MIRLVRLLATFFGLGFIPIAPGTFGTLGGVVVYYLERDLPLSFKIFILLFITLVGIPIADKADESWNTHDNGRIVIDEVAGYLLGVLLIPFSWKSALVGFVLFRFFDILKIFPANVVDRKLGGGAGVMLDDLVSGVYTLIVMLILVHMGVL